MTDAGFLQLLFFMAMSFIFLLIGLMNDDDFPNNVVYNTLCMIFSFTTGALLWATLDPWAQITQFAFWLFGFLSFVFVIFHSLDAYRVKQNDRWGGGRYD